MDANLIHLINCSSLRLLSGDRDRGQEGRAGLKERKLEAA